MDEVVIENDPHDPKPNIVPVIKQPPDPITSCKFTIAVDTGGNTASADVYDAGLRQVTRSCTSTGSGPVGTLPLVHNSTTGLEEGEVCLCGIPDGSMIYIHIIPHSLGIKRTIRHGGTCPACIPTQRHLDSVVEELRAAVTLRVAEKLREVVETIAPAEPVEKRRRKSKAGGAAKPGKKRRGRRR